MKRSSLEGSLSFVSASMLVAAGCSGPVDSHDDLNASGGSRGALVASGGSANATGDQASSGGANGGDASGGSATGGTDESGGAASVGGSPSGAETGSGGTSDTGGTSTGGSSTDDGANEPDSAVCPPGITKTITVAKDGSGQFSKVQAAIDSIPSGSTAHIRINIKGGTYYEQIRVENRTNLCFVGASAESTVLTFDDSAAKAQARTGSTVNGYSFTVNSNDFSAAHISFENTCVGCGQATALGATALRSQFLDCRFLGMQDTLYVKKGTQYFKDCYAEGNVDFIYGAGASAFEDCEIHSRANGVLVAPNTDISSPYGIVVFGGKLTAASGVGAKSVALGRPWEKDGAAVFLNVEMGAHISAAGFVAMSGVQSEVARFGEYLSTGPGANAGARSGYQLTSGEAATYTLAKMFGSWTPSYSQ